MPAAQRIDRDGDRPVVVKTAAGPGPDADRLAAEAQVLAGAGVPGVVEVVRAGPTPAGGFELVTALAGSRTLAGARLDVGPAAAVVAAVAATVADLHDLGIVHGRLTPDHVVLHGSGRPVLCGFAAAGGVTGSGPADDVAALGELLALLVCGPADAAGDWEPIPERRLGRRARAGFARRSLLTLADQARAEDPLARPSARALALAIRNSVPAARLAGREGDDGEVAPAPEVPMITEDAARRPLGALLAGAVGLGLLVFGVSSLLRPTVAPTTGPRPLPTMTTTTTTTTTAAAGTAPSPASGATTTPSPASVSAAIVGDGVVELDGVRYGVGRAGDHLALGDWDCDGTTTVAAVRPSTGEVFVFAGWATPATPVVVDAVAVVPGAAGVDPTANCSGLTVIAADGARTLVRYPAGD